MYDPERIERIEYIMRTLWAYVEVGDEIEFGLVGDPQFPDEYKLEQPVGIVVSINDCSSTMQVKTKDGLIIDVPAYSVDPKQIWDFTNEKIHKVLRRVRKRFDPGRGLTGLTD